jgi:hypothetical protein
MPGLGSKPRFFLKQLFPKKLTVEKYFDQKVKLKNILIKKRCRFRILIRIFQSGFIDPIAGLCIRISILAGSKSALKSKLRSFKGTK